MEINKPFNYFVYVLDKTSDQSELYSEEARIIDLKIPDINRESDCLDKKKVLFFSGYESNLNFREI